MKFQQDPIRIGIDKNGLPQGFEIDRDTIAEYLAPDFTDSELIYPHLVIKLCEAIEQDKYQFDPPLEAGANTIAWLNELLGQRNFLAQIDHKKPNWQKDLGQDQETHHRIQKLRDLVRVYPEDSSILKPPQKIMIKRLNRCLLETLYPQQTPQKTNLKRDYWQGAEKTFGFNYFERKIMQDWLRTNLTPCEIIPILISTDDNPLKDDAHFSFNVGFIIMAETRKQIYYFRIQNHLRQMGLARRTLRELLRREDISPSDISLKFIPPSRSAPEAATIQDGQDFEQLFQSVKAEIQGRRIKL